MTGMTDNLDGRLLRFWRERRGYTQEQLAAKVQKILRKDPSFTRGALAMVESGRNGMPPATRDAVWQALEVTGAQFYAAESKLDESAA